MISYQDHLVGVTPERLIGFWSGWQTPPTPELHLRILAGSETILLAIDAEADDRVVGFINAIGDGVVSSYIPFLEVLPDYRGRGIGTELVRRMLERLHDRYMVDLVCDEDLVPFYERLGLTRYGAMVQRRPEVLQATTA
jgi:ribosomal protein S18 acetylase RimI-like enzyme